MKQHELLGIPTSSRHDRPSCGFEESKILTHSSLFFKLLTDAGQVTSYLAASHLSRTGRLRSRISCTVVIQPQVCYLLPYDSGNTGVRSGPSGGLYSIMSADRPAHHTSQRVSCSLLLPAAVRRPICPVSTEPPPRVGRAVTPSIIRRGDRPQCSAGPVCRPADHRANTVPRNRPAGRDGPRQAGVAG